MEPISIKLESAQLTARTNMGVPEYIFAARAKFSARVLRILHGALEAKAAVPVDFRFLREAGIEVPAQLHIMRVVAVQMLPRCPSWCPTRLLFKAPRFIDFDGILVAPKHAASTDEEDWG